MWFKLQLKAVCRDYLGKGRSWWVTREIISDAKDVYTSHPEVLPIFERTAFIYRVGRRPFSGLTTRPDVCISRHFLQIYTSCRSTLPSRVRSCTYTLRRPWATELISCPAQNHLKSASGLIYTKSAFLNPTMSAPANTACPCGGRIYHKADVLGETIKRHTLCITQLLRHSVTLVLSIRLSFTR